MNFTDYLAGAEKNFPAKKDAAIGRFNATHFYEEQFKWRWFATKLKIYSFVAYLPSISKQDIAEYSKECLHYARNNYKGLPRGVQTGVISFNVLASENIDAEAISFSESPPKKHFAMFEMPIIYDLSGENAHYYKKEQIWGSVYHSFFMEYIEKNFDVRK